MSTSHAAAYGRAHAVLVQMFAGHDNPGALASEVLAELRRQGWKWMPREDPPTHVRPSPPPEQWEGWKSDLHEAAEERRRVLEAQAKAADR